MHDSLALGLQVCEIAILERDFANAADAALLVGRTYFLLGDQSSALRYAKSAIDYADGTDDETLKARGKNALANMLQADKRFDDAERLYIEALQSATKGGDSTVAGGLHENIAQVQLLQGRFADALISFNKSLRIRSSIDDQKGLAHCNCSMGVFYSEMEEYRRSLEHFHNSLRYYTHHPEGNSLANVYFNIGQLHVRLGEYAQAMISMQNGADEFKRIRDTRGYYFCQVHIAEISRKQGNLEYAQSILSGIERDVADELVSRDAETSFYAAKAALATTIGNYTQATDFAHKCIASAVYFPEDVDIANSYKILAANENRLGNHDQAIGYLQKAKAVAKNAGTHYVLRDVMSALVEAYKLSGDKDGVIATLEEIQLLNERHFLLRSQVITAMAESERRLRAIEEAEKEARQQAKNAVKRASELERALLKVQELNRRVEEEKVRFETLYQQNRSLLSIVAHDLNNPLTSMKLSLSMLATYGVQQLGEKRVARLVESCEHTIQVMQDLTRRLLDLESLEHGTLSLNVQHLHLATAVGQVVEEFSAIAQKKGIAFSVSLQSDVKAAVDLTRFLDVVRNLVSNAVKYSPPGNTVYISVHPDLAGHHAILSVMDSGEGIPPEQQPLMFRKFQKLGPRPTAGEASSGLGLAIVKLYTEAMGGTVHYALRPEGGSHFSIHLPTFA